MVLFRWFGLSCFEISNSLAIVTDPHDGKTVGLAEPNIKGDVITISHNHFDHASGEDLVSKENSNILKETGKYQINDIQVEGISNERDDSRGRNIYFIFTVDGFRICHLGDLGYRLSSKNIEKIKPVDILLIPVGGTGGQEGREAAQLIEKLDPRIVIPMHYKINELNIDISDEKEFLRIMRDKNWNIEDKDKIKIKNLPKNKKII
ncbi:hypothetical protein AKJ49_01785 [candidate division MSBL1 archaeon SCGC-AAA382A03]|uniref:Metallo-beta-lactamase domain-containing protein n=1 Tax=candidate division MSBL1 archaeon SCGC-AAA382A03 TaxID=1698278 RepID=A0A133VE61_9EURY|nr:hypothetical protein AKJ49_01785 [candidate division MSBL1 archaeon SCGC-AAA382A03]